MDETLLLPAIFFFATRYAAFKCPKSQKNVYLHLQMMGDKPKGMVVDHIDGNTWNNQKANLRFITQQQNIWRKKKMNNKTAYIGLFQKANSRFTAKINIHRKSHVSGTYATGAAAAGAYNEACKRTRGAYAILNLTVTKYMHNCP